ncbi:MAG TPA: TonB-dependent receptor [Longimicrobium sp.]|jgi:outer membrane receptor protein involved in Fe transport|uniref:TonB-dependent receptor domain-containing protein n=1 Tax=Longimicrobium sp. TaxID=2029185 RepID=UPI002EDB93A1
MKRLVVATALTLLSAAPALAQAPGQRPPGQQPAQPPAAGPGEIRGTVVDAESSAPVGAASVEVWSTADSALVAGAIARPDGSFRIQGLRPGTYYLRVSMMGYGPQRTAPLTVAAASPRANAGSVGLTRRALVLDAIGVEAERPAISIAPDRNAYSTRDVAPAATTASEVLEAVPSVQVDADGKVSLRGNENVVVQINGRPSPIRGEQLAGYLRQLPANTLDRVEVIPNPSARHDPEGMAGIINIILKQNVDLGLSGGLTLVASTADRYTASGNLGYQQGPATMFFSYGFTTDDRSQSGINDRTRLGAQRAPTSITEQDISGSNGNSGHNLNATLDYRLGERDVLSNALLLNLRGETDESLSAYTELDGTRLLLDAYDRVQDSRTDNWMGDYTLAWKRTLEPQRHELTAEVRVNASDEDDRNLLWRQAGEGGALTDAEDNRTDARTYQLTAQADYTRTLAERTKLETGYRGNARWLDRDFTVLRDVSGSGVWVSDPLSNALEFDETVNAVYGVVSHGTGALELQAGLRAEYATREFSLADSAGSFPYDYTSFFPSGLASYSLSDRTQVKLSYSRRIRRPGSQELNPFPAFFDLQNVFLGNPRLNPEYTDAIELGVQHSGQLGSLQLSPFYRRTTDVIRFIVNTDDVVAGREVTSISFRNLATGSSWGADLNGTLRLGSRFSGLAALNVFKMVTEGGSGEASLSSDAVTWSGRVNGTFNLTPRTAVTAAYFYRAPMNVEGGRFDAFGFANLSVRQKMRGDRMTVTLRLSDPFNTQRFRIRAGDDNVIQLTERTFTSRAIHLGVQYTFGRPPRVRQPRQDPQPEPTTPFGG